MMVDPLSLSVLGGVAAAEGIKFLYGQATELLRRRAARKEAESKGETVSPGPIKVEAPDLLEGRVEPAVEDAQAVDELAGELSALRRELADYVDGLAVPDASDPKLNQTVDALRRALEASIGQTITFKGEQREPSGTVVVGRVDAETVRGIAAGVDTDVVAGEMRGTARADTVEESGRLAGVRIRSQPGRIPDPPIRP
jgi:hypothetical protein